jgi:hypothetical protein
MAYDTLLVNGTDLSNYARIISTWDSVHGLPPVVGEDPQVPLRAGAVHVDKVAGPRDLTVLVDVLGVNPSTGADVASPAKQWNDNWRTLTALLWEPQPTTLTRRLAFTAGNEDQVQAATFLGATEPSFSNSEHALVALSWRLLDGAWYASAATTDTISTASDTFTLAGTARSRRMTLTFSGVNATQTLTNTTLGVSVTVTGDKTTHAVVLDVDDFTATQNGSSVVGTVSHSGDPYWMVFAPGSNALTLSGGGSVAISCQAAYL